MLALPKVGFPANVLNSERNHWPASVLILRKMHGKSQTTEQQRITKGGFSTEHLSHAQPQLWATFPPSALKQCFVLEKVF